MAIEGSGGYGRPLAAAVAAAGLEAVEVPPQMTAHARLGQRTRTKTDETDALLIARIGARDSDLPRPRPGGAVEDLRCVVRYRRELVKARNQHINRLHGDLEQIRCGYHRRMTKAKFAMANGTAPIEASSGRIVRHRLNRGGNRQLNKAIHTIALTQISRPGTEGRRYYQRCLDNGKTKREAIRALKRRITDRIWTHLQTNPPAYNLT